jgi:hypothetical protein
VTDEVRESPRSLRTVVHRECEFQLCVRPFRVLDLAVIEKDRSDQWVSYRPGEDDVPLLIGALGGRCSRSPIADAKPSHPPGTPFEAMGPHLSILRYLA